MSDTIGFFEQAGRVAFYGVAFATIAGALISVWARNLFRAALGLALALFGVAVIYLFLEAEFLAVVQLLIYVGAILTLLLFGVMLTARIADPTTPRWNRQAVWAAGVTFCIGAGLALAFLKVPWAIAESRAVPLSTIGWMLIRAYVLPFELLGLLLLGALVGAIVIARRDRDSNDTQR